MDGFVKTITKIRNIGTDIDGSKLQHEFIVIGYEGIENG